MSLLEHFISRIPENVVVEFYTGKNDTQFDGITGGSLNGKRFIKWGVKWREKKKPSKIQITWVGFVWKDTWEEAFEKLVQCIESEENQKRFCK